MKRSCHVVLPFAVLLLFASSNPSNGEDAAGAAKPQKPESQETLVTYQRIWNPAWAEWSGKKLSFAEPDGPVNLSLAKLIQKTGLTIGISEKARKTLETRALAVEFVDSTAGNILEFIAEFTDTSIVIDKSHNLVLVAVGEEETLALAGWRDLPRLMAAERSRTSDDLAINSGYALSVLLKKLSETTATVSAKTTPLKDVLADLARQSNLKLEVSALDPAGAELADLPVTLEMKDQPLKEIFDALGKALKLRWIPSYNRVEFGHAQWAAFKLEDDAKEERERSKRVAAQAELCERELKIVCERAPTSEVAARIEAALGVPCRVDAASYGLRRTWTFTDRARPLYAYISEMSEENDLMATYFDGVLWIYVRP